MIKWVQRAAQRVEQWRDLDENYAVGELRLRLCNWATERRFIAVRERVREARHKVGRKLIDVPGYTFRIFVTNCTEAAEEVWRDYHRRADVENRIAELKHDLGADGFCNAQVLRYRCRLSGCAALQPAGGIPTCCGLALARLSRTGHAAYSSAQPISLVNCCQSAVVTMTEEPSEHFQQLSGASAPGEHPARPSACEITHLLQAWCNGDQSALAKLAPIVESELRRLARVYLSRESTGNTLQPTALVNEAYLRLIEWSGVRWQNRAHFHAVAAKMMRRVLVNQAVARRRQKRGAGVVLVSLADAESAPDRGAEVVALDEALKRLAGFDDRKSRVVELRFFGGLNADETAEVLGISTRTVNREWDLARSWLFRELRGQENASQRVSADPKT